VDAVEFAGAPDAAPAPRVIEAVASARAIILAPSNPIISIGPILAVPGIREALGDTGAPVVAISPIVAGEALKGPAARMMQGLGLQPSVSGVAKLYKDFVRSFVLDEQDRGEASRVEALGMRPFVCDTIMKGPAEKQALARAALEAAGLRSKSRAGQCNG
jgi:LPPG:FO 2-phospho-L-lactate transferase